MEKQMAAAVAGVTIWIPLISAMFGAFVGGGFALLGGLLADMRKAAAERRAQLQRERALLTGMYAVRNHIAQRLQDWTEEGLTSALEPLRSAQSLSQN